MNNFEDFGANFFSMSYTPCIYQICISKCHVYLEESQNPPVSFLFLRSPSLQSPSLFFWIANLSLTLPPQKIHIFVTIYISSPFSRVIYVAPSLPILKHRTFFFVLTYPTHLVFVFSYNQHNTLLVSLRLVSSHPTGSFVFFFPINTFLYLKLLLTIGYPTRIFTLNLQYTFLICFFFWLRIAYSSVLQ